MTDIRDGSKAVLTAPKSDFCSTPESGLKSDIAPCPKSAKSGFMHRNKFGEFDPLCGAFHAAVDLAAQRPEIDRLGQKRLGAILERLTLGLRIAVSRYHAHRNSRPEGLLVEKKL